MMGATNTIRFNYILIEIKVLINLTVIKDIERICKLVF